MPVRLYAHLSWTCWARLPLIDQPVADFLAPFLLAEVKRHDARVIEIGIVPNHVHLLLELPAAFDVPRLVQGLKGASARLANRDGHARNQSLRWDSGYDLRSVGSNSCRRSRTTFGSRNSSTEAQARSETG